MKNIITAVLVLAITLTFTACDEKKKQDGADTTASEPAAAITLTDTRDNKTYKTVKIGEQVWMAENLNYEAKEGSMCYDNKPANCQKYGRFYEWYYTATEACPSGWHLPNKDEWQTLVDLAGGKEIAGKKLKAKSGWNKNGNGTDDFGFAALPGGGGNFEGSFYDIGFIGEWWTATEGEDTAEFDTAYVMDMHNDREDVGNVFHRIDHLHNVRCIKD